MPEDMPTPDKSLKELEKDKKDITIVYIKQEVISERLLQ